jgi:hypothetical protein
MLLLGVLLRAGGLVFCTWLFLTGFDAGGTSDGCLYSRAEVGCIELIFFCFLTLLFPGIRHAVFPGTGDLVYWCLVNW